MIRNIKVTLWGGPLDGDTKTIDDSSHLIRVPVAYTSIISREPVETQPTIIMAMYELNPENKRYEWSGYEN